MALSPAWLDELRSRITLSALIGRTVKVQRAGREFKACCPFHNEKTPSFYVNDDKGFYWCFGCGAHGDAIRWLTDQRGLDFMDAVRGTKRSPKRMKLAEMHFGYPETDSGYFRRFKVVYSIPTDEMKVSKQ